MEGTMRTLEPIREESPNADSRRPVRKDPMLRVLRAAAIFTVVMLAVSVIVDNDRTYELVVEAEAVLTEDWVEVAGTTNLLDDAILEFRLIHPRSDSDGLPNDHVVRRAWVDEGAFRVRFPREVIPGATETDSDPFDVSDISIVILFEIVMSDRIQPVDIVDKYGGFGEHIAGPHVVADGRGNHLHVALAIVDHR